MILHVVPVLGIIGGEIAADYPFFVLVLRGQTRCGGTIVSKGAVLTAAHCLYNQEENRWSRPNEISVFRGDFSTPNHWKGTTVSVRNYVYNNFYYRDYYDAPANFDMALIRLSKSAETLNLEKSILSVCKRPSYRVLHTGVFVGLGLVNETLTEQSLPSQLMEATMLLDESCGNYFRAGVSIDDTRQLCYNGVHGAYVCYGDSGGPIVYKPKGKVACLIGISSVVDSNCTNPRWPAVFTSARALRPWVLRKIDLNL